LPSQRRNPNGRNQKVLQKTLQEIVRQAIFEELLAPSRTVACCRQAWSKEERSETIRCKA